jgi:hypothetical protein
MFMIDEKSAGGGIAPEGDVAEGGAVVAGALERPGAGLAALAQRGDEADLAGSGFVLRAGVGLAVGDPEFDAVGVGGIHGAEFLQRDDLGVELSEDFGLEGAVALAAVFELEVERMPGVVGGERDLDAGQAVFREGEIEGGGEDDGVGGFSGELVSQVGVGAGGVGVQEPAGGAG